MAAAVRPPAVVPKAPPSDFVSSAKQKTAPNWALKTMMAATGAMLAVLLVIKLIVNLWFFTGRDHFDVVTQKVHTFLTPYLPPDTWLWIIRIITIALVIIHIVLAIVLVLRAKRGRGVYRAKLHGGLHAWLTRLMPFTGVVIGLFAVFYVLDQMLQMVVPHGGPPAGSYDMLRQSLVVPWIAVIYIVGLAAIALHVLHGLATVATIAAGTGVWAGNLRHYMLVAGGIILIGLLLANIAIPVCALGGWLR